MVSLKKLTAAALIVSAASGCGKSDSQSETTATAPNGSAAGGSSSASELATAFPGSLALAVFPEGSAAALLLSETPVDNPNATKTVAEKVEETKKILSGEAESCFNPQLMREWRRDSVTCYEFDSDMNPSEWAGDIRKFGTKDGTNGEGEACMVSFTRSEVQESVQIVDQGLALVSGMLCQAKKDGLASTLPAIGEKLDLTPSAGKATGAESPVTKASLERLADVEGSPVYRSEIALTDRSGAVREFWLVHSPAADGSETGTLWTKATGGLTAGGPQNDPNNMSNMNRVMSVNYARTTESGIPRMRFEVRRAHIVKTLEPFTASGLVNYGVISENAANSENNANKYVAFDMNPDTGAGTMSYWINPGGSFNESARGFLFNVEADASTGALSGCGISGATQDISIRKSLSDSTKQLKPVRHWHPRGATNISADKDSRYGNGEGNKVTKQCFKQGTTGVYAIDTAKITDPRGYDVTAPEGAGVEPPKAPAKKLEGTFIPD